MRYSSSFDSMFSSRACKEVERTGRMVITDSNPFSLTTYSNEDKGGVKYILSDVSHLFELFATVDLLSSCPCGLHGKKTSTTTNIKNNWRIASLFNEIVDCLWRELWSWDEEYTGDGSVVQLIPTTILQHRRHLRHGYDHPIGRCGVLRPGPLQLSISAIQVGFQQYLSREKEICCCKLQGSKRHHTGYSRRLPQLSLSLKR